MDNTGLRIKCMFSKACCTKSYSRKGAADACHLVVTLVTKAVQLFKLYVLCFYVKDLNQTAFVQYKTMLSYRKHFKLAPLKICAK